MDCDKGLVSVCPQVKELHLFICSYFSKIFFSFFFWSYFNDWSWTQTFNKNMTVDKRRGRVSCRKVRIFKTRANSDSCCLRKKPETLKLLLHHLLKVRSWRYFSVLYKRSEPGMGPFLTLQTFWCHYFCDASHQDRFLQGESPMYGETAFITWFKQSCCASCTACKSLWTESRVSNVFVWWNVC